MNNSRSLLDHPIISQRYFYPRQGTLPGAWMVDVDGARLACWRSAPASKRPLLIHFHGNGEVVHDWIGNFPQRVAQMGYDVLLAEYRGYGGSTGAPALGRMLGDVSSIVRACGVPPARIVAFGRSVGSIFAAELVHQFGHAAGLVLESGISDVMQRLERYLDPAEIGTDRAGLQRAVREHLDQAAKLRGYKGPTLIMHAEHDDIVGFEHARENHRSSGAKDKSLVAFPRGDHNTIMFANGEAYFDELEAFLKRAHPG